MNAHQCAHILINLSRSVLLQWLLLFVLGYCEMWLNRAETIGMLRLLNSYSFFRCWWISVNNVLLITCSLYAQQISLLWFHWFHTWNFLKGRQTHWHLRIHRHSVLYDYRSAKAYKSPLKHTLSFGTCIYRIAWTLHALRKPLKFRGRLV